MMLCDYMAICRGYEKEEIEKWRRTRALMGLWVEGDIRDEFPLPNDFDYLQPTKKTREEIDAFAKKRGFDIILKQHQEKHGRHSKN